MCEREGVLCVLCERGCIVCVMECCLSERRHVVCVRVCLRKCDCVFRAALFRDLWRKFVTLVDGGAKSQDRRDLYCTNNTLEKFTGRVTIRHRHDTFFFNAPGNLGENLTQDQEAVQAT